MDTLTFTFVLISGVVLLWLISFIPFIDFIKILFVFLKKVPRDYEREKEQKNSAQYKKHKRRWILIYCLASVVYAAVYCAFAFYFNSIMTGFISALIASALYFGIANNFEQKKRKELNKK